MFSGLAALLLTVLTADPVCGTGTAEPLRRAFLEELNSERLSAGRQPVAPHPALCDTARWRAAGVVASGSPDARVETVNETTRRLYRLRYAAHHWTAGVVIGSGASVSLARWREARPEWFRQAIEGDFEHAGIAVARRQGRPVYALVLAISQRTVEWRQALPLADLETVRAEVLAAVNAARRRAGRQPVAGQAHLDLAAQRHAEDMLRRRYYDHESPEGDTARQRARAAGYSGSRTLTENIAKGLFTPEEVVRRWLDSSGHRRNILRRGAAQMGAGVAFGENANGFEVLWVQVFAGGR